MSIHTFRRRRRRPEPTSRLAWAIAIAILLLLLGCGITFVRAEDDALEAVRAAADTVEATPTATPAPEPTRYAPASRSGREAVRELAEASFAPEWVPWAIRTAWCESRWDLYAYSAGFDRRWGVFYEHVGMLQVDGVSWRHLAQGNFLEPAVNVAVAAVVLERQGVGAWPWCGR